MATYTNQGMKPLRPECQLPLSRGRRLPSLSGRRADGFESHETHCERPCSVKKSAADNLRWLCWQHIDLDLQNSFLFMAWRCTAYRPITGLRKQIQASLFASFKFCGLSPIHSSCVFPLLSSSLPIFFPT